MGGAEQGIRQVEPIEELWLTVEVRLSLLSFCSASFHSLVFDTSNLQEQVSVIVPRAQNDPSVGYNTQGGNIEIV